MEDNKKPFVTDKIAAGYMIQRGGKNHDGEWLTPEGEWSESVFDAATWPTKKAARKALKTLFG
ncbi:MAG: hypothetical protein PHD51_02180 [Patescibacteria group bacterium]|nr:hypothetical protein [Patescibacteria group bacterium]MDD5490331.1 hypothetical protein [Patescibacteria group bacterium]